MHEFSVMSGVVGAILDECGKRRAKEVKRVELKVGKLTMLGGEQLKFAFETLAKGSVMEGSELDIIAVEPEVSCGQCGYRGEMGYIDEPEFHLLVPSVRCPECGGRVEVLAGLECAVGDVRMMVEDE